MTSQPALDGRCLVLIRHAHSQAQPGVPASRWGLSQAGLVSCALLAVQLQPYLPAALYASGEPKARQTAEAVGQSLGLAVRTASGLHQHARDTAPWFDRRVDYIRAVERMLEHPDELEMGEETAAQALRRFDQAVQRVVAGHPRENVWIATHGTVLSLFVGYYNPISLVDFWRKLEMPDIVPLSLPGFRLPASG